jgi:polyisoprenoid-binding protein YceI
MKPQAAADALTPRAGNVGDERPMHIRVRWLLPVYFLGAGAAAAHHLDGNNTRITLEIERLGLNWFSAAFPELSGDFEPAPDGSGGRLSVSVRMAALDAHSPYWNERLRSPEWLDAGRYPQMTFQSTGITLEGTQRAQVRGELTLHGITRPLTLTLSDIDCPEVRAAVGDHCRFIGRATLRRSDFGLPHGFWQGGDAVEIIVRGD